MPNPFEDLQEIKQRTVVVDGAAVRSPVLVRVEEYNKLLKKLRAYEEQEVAETEPGDLGTVTEFTFTQNGAPLTLNLIVVP